MRVVSHERVSPAEARRRILDDETAATYVSAWHQLQKAKESWLAAWWPPRKARVCELRARLDEVRPRRWGWGARVAWYGLVCGDMEEVWRTLTRSDWRDAEVHLREAVVRPPPPLPRDDLPITSEKDDWYGWSDYNIPAGGWGSDFDVPEEAEDASNGSDDARDVA
ncbi:hypothetical protein LCGC14_0983360 [marine sediment metagenome]|uniref:Uncharacterized protein n=1 Tax=marine sediment metagenome TaxID=412755 RepID=A0A0F9NUB3_9ZZZZ